MRAACPFCGRGTTADHQHAGRSIYRERGSAFHRERQRGRRVSLRSNETRERERDRERERGDRASCGSYRAREREREGEGEGGCKMATGGAVPASCGRDQLLSAGVNIFYKLAVSDGMDLKVLIAYRYIFAAVFLAPVAYFVESYVHR